jgi:hypothetical protein
MGMMPIAKGRAVAAEHIRHLHRRAHDPRSGRRRHLEAQMIEWARRAADGAGCHLRIARRGVDVAMAEQRLDDTDAGAALEQMGGEDMA